jgi:hypothetical protein
VDHDDVKQFEFGLRGMRNHLIKVLPSTTKKKFLRSKSFCSDSLHHDIGWKLVAAAAFIHVDETSIRSTLTTMLLNGTQKKTRI